MILESNYIPYIAQALQAGHAAIMVGSGFSRYADKCNDMDHDFLSWNQRIDCLYKKRERTEEYRFYNKSAATELCPVTAFSLFCLFQHLFMKHRKVPKAQNDLHQG